VYLYIINGALNPISGSTKKMSLHELFGDLIYSYTRKQAIADGILIDVTSMFPSDTRLFKYPVAITREIWNLIEGKNAGVWVWDICWMCTKFVVSSPDESTIITKCHLPSAPGSEEDECYDLKAVCHPGDNLEPVITIMFIDQD
jgi:hypothetical protein